MPRKSENLFGLPNPILGDKKSTKKRDTPTPSERIYVWEHPEQYGRTCSICHKKIVKLSDLEFDHTKPYQRAEPKWHQHIETAIELRVAKA